MNQATATRPRLTVPRRRTYNRIFNVSYFKGAFFLKVEITAPTIQKAANIAKGMGITPWRIS